jgi:hypothetical protein
VSAAKLDAIATRWRDDAARFAELGQDGLARMSEAYAREYEAAVRDWRAEELTLEQAANESGLAYTTLQHKLRDGSLQNVGEKGRPRVRREDLFRKGGRADWQPSDGPDLAAEVFGR